MGCIDDAPASVTLVDVTLGWADLLGEVPIVLTVAEPDPEPVGGGPSKRMFGPDGDPEDFLEALVAAVRDRVVRSRTYVKYDPVGPAAGVRSYLTEHPARLVVLGARTPGPGSSGWLQGASPARSCVEVRRRCWSCRGSLSVEQRDRAVRAG